jgi:hypothetical protein
MNTSVIESSPTGAYYVPVAKHPEPGKAPGMRVQLLTSEGMEPRQYAIIFGKGR